MAKASTKPNSGRKFATRPARAITAEYLQNVAFYYLGRYAATEHSLRQVLHRRLRRNDAIKDAAALALVEATIEKARKLKLFDDAQFAASKTRTMNRAGKSRRVIAGKLQQKGVAPQVIATAWDAQQGEVDDPEYAAAMRFARRKKLGPFGTRADADPRKQLQQMARAGFSFVLARQILQLTADAADEAAWD